MLDLEVNSKYSDTIERVFYNGFLSSISLNGKAFFYKNPLEIIPEFEDRFPATKDTGNFPEMERLEVFECSCCPPNISRLFATIGGYIYSKEDQAQTLLVHQYISSRTNGVEMKSGFPNDGAVTLTVDGYQTIGVRIPGWCTEYTILKNGQEAEGTIKNGYLYLSCDGKTKLDIRFAMPIVFMEANSNVTQNAGKICCMRGPLVYCAEKSYNQYDIHKTYFAEDAVVNAEISFDPTFHANTITMDAFVKTPRQELYYPASKNYERVKAKLIPYYGFANKGASEMMVWLNKK